MPIVFEEKVNRKLDDGRKATFHLWTHSEDLADEDEGCFTCNIKAYTDGRISGEYYRKFLVRKYTKHHFSRFVEKFCDDKKYREQFNISHDRISEHPSGDIDPEIKEVVERLNELDLKTIYSCQGTKTMFADRPKISDGHSILAYIIFKKPMPPILLKLLSMYDLFLTVNKTTVYAKKRKYNMHFKDIMAKAIEEYTSIQE